MNGVRQALLVLGSSMALTAVAAAAYFAFAYPSITSLLTFLMVVPVFLILGLGFLKAARRSN
jgi:hypothetical protein